MAELESVSFETLYELQQYLFADFSRFLSYAIDFFGMDIGQHQLEFAEFITSGEKQVLIKMPRGWSKTTMLALYVLWRCGRVPNTRVRIISATHQQASSMTRQILEMAFALPVTQFLCPKGKSGSETKIRWACSHSVEKEANIECAGSDSSVTTGTRADLVIFDDLESQMNSTTEEMRAKLVTRLNEAFNILHPLWYRTNGEEILPEKTQIIVTGTPQSPFSIYRIPKDDQPHPLRHFKEKIWTALDSNNESTFPERFTTEELLARKSSSLPYMWALNFQMDTSVVDERSQIINIQLVRDHAQRFLKRFKDSNMDPVILKKFIVVDPAYGAHDETAYTVIGMCQGTIFIEEVGGFVLSPDKSLPLLVQVMDKHRITSMVLETNLPDIENVFKNAVKAQGYHIQIETFRVGHDGKSKEERMATWLGWTLNTGQAILNPKILDDERTFEQIAKFSDIYELALDDRIDSMASGIQFLSDRLYHQDPNHKAKFASLYQER